MQPPYLKSCKNSTFAKFQTQRNCNKLNQFYNIFGTITINITISLTIVLSWQNKSLKGA